MKSLGDFDLFFPVLLSRLSNLSPYVKLWFAYIYFCTGFFFFGGGGKLENFCSILFNLCWYQIMGLGME